jgi:hypothetical protein
MKKVMIELDTRPNGKRIERIVQILCEKEQTVALLSLATRLCPDAIPAIKRALGFPADQLRGCFTRP